MQTRSIHVLAALALAAAPHALGRAGDPLADAKRKMSRKFAKDVNVALAKLEDRLDARVTLLRQELEEYRELANTAEFDPLDARTQLVRPLIEFQGQLRNDVPTFGTDVGNAAIAAYAKAEDLGIAAVDMPADFRFGAGGTIDGLEARVAKLVDAEYRAVEKSLARIAKTLRNRSNVAFEWRLTRPYRFAPPMAKDGSGYFNTWVFASALTLDVMAAFSELGTPNDVFVVVGGHAFPPATLVSLSMLDQDLTPGSITPAIGADGTIEYAFPGCSEGNLVVLAKPNLEKSGGVRAEVSIR